MIKVKVIADQCELMQDDLMTILDGLPDEAITRVCQVIVDRCKIIDVFVAEIGSY